MSATYVSVVKPVMESRSPENLLPTKVRDLFIDHGNDWCERRHE